MFRNLKDSCDGSGLNTTGVTPVGIPKILILWAKGFFGVMLFNFHIISGGGGGDGGGGRDGGGGGGDMRWKTVESVGGGGGDIGARILFSEFLRGDTRPRPSMFATE